MSNTSKVLTDVSALHPVEELKFADATGLSIFRAEDSRYSSGRYSANLSVEIVSTAVSIRVVRCRTCSDRVFYNGETASIYRI